MTDTVIILGSSYNLAEWEKSVMKQAICDNPSFTMEELGEILGISPRTVERKMKEYKLNLTYEEKQLILKSWKKPT